jgi:hypothetical protein
MYLHGNILVKSTLRSPKTGRVDSVTRPDFEIPRSIHPVNLIVHHAQKSEMEEAMIKQEHGMKDTLELLYAWNFIPFW